MTILAYVIVIGLSQFAFTLSQLIATPILSAAFFFLRNKWLPSVLAAICGTVGAFYFGFFIFHWTDVPYGIIQFGCSLLGILMPLINDYRRYSSQLVAYKRDAIEEVEQVFGDQQPIVRGLMQGEWIGILVAYWMILG